MDEKLLETISTRIAEAIRPQKIILFGSWARGERDAHSDIDLLIIKDTPARFLDRWTRVQRILTGSHGSIPLEPVVLTPQ